AGHRHVMDVGGGQRRLRGRRRAGYRSCGHPRGCGPRWGCGPWWGCGPPRALRSAVGYPPGLGAHGPRGGRVRRCPGTVPPCPGTLPPCPGTLPPCPGTVPPCPGTEGVDLGHLAGQAPGGVEDVGGLLDRLPARAVTAQTPGRRRDLVAPA